jgi:hypothetical protein
MPCPPAQLEWDESGCSENVSHGADAFRYLAMSWREPQRRGEARTDPIKEMLKPLTWNGVWDVHVHEQIERGADPDDFVTELRN